MLLIICVCTFNNLINRPRAVKIHGVKYSEQAVIRVTNEDNHEQPYIYCKIITLYVYHDYKVFVSVILDILDYDEHTKSYVVSCSDRMVVAVYSNLYIHGVLHLKTKGPNTYLVEKHKIL